MRFSIRALTAENITDCQGMWGDRSFYAADEFVATIRRATDLLRAHRARGALVVDDYGRTRFFGMTVFASEAAVDRLTARLRPRIGAALFSECQAGAILGPPGGNARRYGCAGERTAWHWPDGGKVSLDASLRTDTFTSAGRAAVARRQQSGTWTASSTVGAGVRSRQSFRVDAVRPYLLATCRGHILPAPSVVLPL